MFYVKNIMFVVTYLYLHTEKKSITNFKAKLDQWSKILVNSQFIHMMKIIICVVAY